MAIVDKIDLFHGLNINPIPLEFSQSMTTLEMLGAIQYKVNDLIDSINQVGEMCNKYTDDQVSTLQKVVKMQIDELTQLINITANNATKYTDEQIATITNIFTRKIDNIDSMLTTINTRLKAIDDYIANDNIVINPTNGVLTSVQDALYAIYDTIRVTLRWEEVDALGLTWQEVEDLNATWALMEYNIKIALGIEIETTALENNI